MSKYLKKFLQRHDIQAEQLIPPEVKYHEEATESPEERNFEEESMGHGGDEDPRMSPMKLKKFGKHKGHSEGY